MPANVVQQQLPWIEWINNNINLCAWRQQSYVWIFLSPSMYVESCKPFHPQTYRSMHFGGCGIDAMVVPPTFYVKLCGKIRQLCKFTSRTLILMEKVWFFSWLTQRGKYKSFFGHWNMHGSVDVIHYSTGSLQSSRWCWRAKTHKYTKKSETKVPKNDQTTT